jgi:tetratricopeptide (TPR) repeat protein
MSTEDGTGGIEARVFEAEALIDRRRYSQARQVLKTTLQTAPQDVRALYLAAFVDYAEDRNKDALAGVADVLQQDPQHYGARRLLALLLADEGDLTGAEGEWITLLRDYPEDADAYSGYAELMLRALEVDKARQLAAEGLRQEPDHEACLYVLALTQIILGEPKDATGGPAALQRLLQEHPERRRTSIALVAALADRGNNRAALRLAQEMLRSSPDSPELVELVRDLRHSTHWSLVPLYPVQRWGWGGSIAIWVVAVALLQLAGRTDSPWATPLAFVWLGYVIYSWTWPPILKRLLA